MFYFLEKETIKDTDFILYKKKIQILFYFLSKTVFST